MDGREPFRGSSDRALWRHPADAGDRLLHAPAQHHPGAGPERASCTGARARSQGQALALDLSCRHRIRLCDTLGFARSLRAGGAHLAGAGPPHRAQDGEGSLALERQRHARDHRRRDGEHGLRGDGLPAIARVIERLGDDEKPLPVVGRTRVERRRGVVAGVAHGVDGATLGEGRRDAQRFLDPGLRHDRADGGERSAHGLGRRAVETVRQQQQEQRLAIGAAMPMLVELVGDHLLDAALDLGVAADLAVVHEHPRSQREGMAVRARGGRAGRGSDVGEEEARANLMRYREQVLVAPGGADVAEDAGPRALAVPADAEAVAVHVGA